MNKSSSNRNSSAVPVHNYSHSRSLYTTLDGFTVDNSIKSQWYLEMLQNSKSGAQV